MMEPPESNPADPPDTAPPRAGAGSLGLVMGGGGARAAYQVGFLRCVARRHPELEIPIITGVSAGAINAALLAGHHGTFAQAVDELSGLWQGLTVDQVFRVDLACLVRNVVRWGLHLVSGGLLRGRGLKSLVDTAPLRRLLCETLHAVDGQMTGIEANLERGRLRALAITTSSYTSGRSVTWVQGEGIQPWRRARRHACVSVLTVDHIMASAALPLFFPAVRIGGEFFGDGGIRLTAPLSPALHLGADRIMVISTRHEPPNGEASGGSDASEVPRLEYPPPAQVMGVLLNALFLDLLDDDVLRLERFNEVAGELGEPNALGLKRVELLTLRPSIDLGRLAGAYEADLPRGFRFLTRGLGTRETRSPDALSMVLFQPDYICRLMDQGEADAEAQSSEIEAFLSASPPDPKVGAR
ncbi:MAG: patatin-like phospholipase family protein [Gemmatimonadota bacterium]